MTDYFTVVVRHNVVCAIERRAEPPAEPIPATPLEAGTRLAANHRAHGCIDGRYHFDDPQRARIFASLCLEFMRGLVEKRLAQIERLPAGTAAWSAQDDPSGPR